METKIFKPMKKALLSLVVFMTGLTMSAQTLMSEDFSNGIPSTWTMFQDNNTAHNSSFTDAWSAQSSYGNPAPSVVSASWFDPAGTADRWLITDAITIPSTGYVFAIDAACYEAAYADGFAVKVSTTDRSSRESFTETILTVPACQTTFTTYMASLDDFAGQTIYIAVIQNSVDKNFLIADNFKVYIPANNDVAVESLNIAQYNTMGTDINISGVISNKGMENLTSFDVTYNVNGGENVAVYHVESIDLEYNETYTFTHNVPFNTTTSGLYTINVTVSNPNGETDENTDNNQASATTTVYDASSASERTVLIEQFTGANCGYCPAGATRIAQAVNGRNDYIWITHHAGFGTDGLSNPSSDQMTWFYGPDGTYAPAIMYDRTRFNTEDPGPVTGVGQANDISATIDQALQIPSFLELDMSGLTYDKNSRSVSGNIAGTFSIEPANPRLTLYVIEDSIVMRQADYNNGGYNNNYLHMRTARTTITGAWGEELTIDENGNFTFPVNYTLPAEYKDWRCRIVAVAYSYDSEDYNNCNVFNSATTENFNGTYVGIDQVSSSMSLDVYPNPVSDHAIIEASEPIQNITVVNAIGQIVHTQNNINNNIFTLNTQQYPAGMYIVTVKSEQGISTKRISIVK